MIPSFTLYKSCLLLPLWLFKSSLSLEKAFFQFFAPNTLYLSEVSASRLVVPTLCDPMDYRLPGSSVRGILQARILEWVAISSSKRSS